MPRKTTPSGVPSVTVKVSPSTEAEGKSEAKSEDNPSLAEEQRIADEAIEQSTAGAISRAIAWIWRIGKDGSKAYVGSVAPDLVTNEFLLENCGGGEFQVDYRRPRKSGGTEQATTRRFLIDGPPKTPPWATVAGPAAPSGNGAAPQGTASMNDIMATGVLTVVKSMQDASTTNAQLTQAAIERLREPKAEGLSAEKLAALLVPIVSAAAQVATAIITRQAPTPPDPMATAAALAALTKQKDPAELIAALAPILRPPAGPPADVTQLGGLIAALKGLVDLKDSLAGNGSNPIDTGNPILDTVRDVARAIPEVASAAKVAMQQRQANPPPSGSTETLQAAPGAQGGAPGDRRALSPGPGEPMGPARITSPTPVITQSPSSESNGAPPEATSDEAMLRAFLAPISVEVLKLCKAGRNPTRIAQSFLDMYEQYLDQIAWWVEQPNCVEHFLRDFPEWKEHKGWLEEFIQTIDRETHEAPQS